MALATKPAVTVKVGTTRSIYDVAVLQKALDILEVLAECPGLGLSELSEKAKASKASTYRVLSTLESRGFAVKDSESRKYSAGVQLISLSCAIVARLDLVKAARPYMKELQQIFDETVNLGILADGQVLYVEILESAQGLRMSSQVGARDALHSTALGKAILSAMPASEARELLTNHRRLAATPRTIVGLEALMDELAVVAERGYSIDDEENEVGARCIGIPIHDLSGRACGGLSVSGPVARIPGGMVITIGERLKEAAAAIEERMGFGTRPDVAAVGAGR